MEEYKDNIGFKNLIIGDYACGNVTEINECTCIGRNAGNDIVSGSNLIRIGHFDTEEDMKNAVKFDGGRVIITKDVMDFLFPGITFKIQNTIEETEEFNKK